MYSIQIICCFRCISWGMDRLNSANLTVIENNDYMTAYKFNDKEIFAIIDYMSYIFNFIGLGTHLFYPFHIHHRYLYQHAKNSLALISSSLLINKMYQCIAYLLLYLCFILLNNTSNYLMLCCMILKMWSLWNITEFCCFLSGCTNECDMEANKQWIWCNNCSFFNLRSIETFYNQWNISVHKFFRKYIHEELCLSENCAIFKQLINVVLYVLLYGFDIDIRLLLTIITLLGVEINMKRKIL
eukprot:230855_1